MLKIKYSKHARERMVLRGISEKEVERALIKGSKSIRKRKIVSSYSYFEVVYRKVGDEIYVITVKPRW
jgi:hypothetical protein